MKLTQLLGYLDSGLMLIIKQIFMVGMPQNTTQAPKPYVSNDVLQSSRYIATKL